MNAQLARAARHLRHIWSDEQGGESVEWPLFVALISLVIAALAWPGLGEAIQSAVDAIAGAFDEIGA